MTHSDISLLALRGSITGLYGDILHGWALDMENHERRLIIEICINGLSVAFVKADNFFSSNIEGDNFHGFTVQLKNTWLANAQTISARIANHPKWLDGTIQTNQRSSSHSCYASSQVWYTGGLKIRGWSWDTAATHRSVKITVRENNAVLCETLANKPHHALDNWVAGDHGFELDLPWEIADGNLHILRIENDNGTELSGSPVNICTWPEGIEPLLRNGSLASHNDSKFKLITGIARHQELMMPKSAGFFHYPQWHAAFQEPVAVPEKLTTTCGIIILHYGDKDLISISLQSATAQRHQPLSIEISPIDDVKSALNKLTSIGCHSIIPIVSGDRLADFALDHLVPLVDSGADWAYGDNDCDEEIGPPSSPWLKPSWDIDLFVSTNMFNIGAIISTPMLIRAIDMCSHHKHESVLSWDMVMAAIALNTETTISKVIHLPRIIYHCHASKPKSPAEAVPDITRIEAASWLVNLISPGAIIEQIPAYPGLLRTRWPMPSDLPKVTVIIPTRDQVAMLRTCVEGVLQKTDYLNLELIIVDNDSQENSTLSYLSELETRGVTILPHPFPFNYASVNNRAAEIATGEYICLLNNDIEIVDANWLREMVSHIIRPGISIVGAKLLWPNGMVQHGGVVIGINGLAAHAGNYLTDLDPGYLGLNQLTHKSAAVTGACLLVKTDEYLANGGMDEQAFPVAFNDIDMCLRINDSENKVVWTAGTKLIHAESASRGKDNSPERISRAHREQKEFTRRWWKRMSNQKNYHPCLSADYLTGPYGGLKMPPSLLSPRISTTKGL